MLERGYVQDEVPHLNLRMCDRDRYETDFPPTWKHIIGLKPFFRSLAQKQWPIAGWDQQETSVMMFPVLTETLRWSRRQPCLPYYNGG